MMSTHNAATAEMDFETLLHMYILEPLSFANDVSIYPGAKLDGRDKAFAESKRQSGHRLIIDEPTPQAIRDGADRPLNQRVLGKAFGDFVQTGLLK